MTTLITPSAPVAVQVRDYQADAIKAVRRAWESGLNRPLLVLPTGAGKTVCFNMISDIFCDEIVPDGRVLMIAHRKELIEQAAMKYRKFSGEDRRIGCISAKMGVFEYYGQITFASKDSLSDSRLDKLIAYGKIDLLIIDEAHHAPARTYGKIIAKLLKLNPDLKILGVTATPMRADGQGLGGIFDVAPWNPESGAVYQMSIGDLISKGYLVSPNWLAIKTGISLESVKKTAGDYNQKQLQSVFETPYTLDLVVKTHIEHAKGKQGIAFTISVSGKGEGEEGEEKPDGGAIGLARRFNEAGIKAGYVHGAMADDERRRVLKQFEEKEIEVLCNCAVLTEGYDCPGIEVIHMVRPTKSDALYIQCMGRGLRPQNGHKAADGERCLIFEYAPAKTRNLENIGFLMGIPQDQLDKIKKAQKALDRQVEDLANGEVMASFGFNGEQIAMIGDGLGINALAIIATEINYFESSDLNWAKVENAGRSIGDLVEGMTVLGLGPSRIDGNERILVIKPQGGDYILYGLSHPPHDIENRVYYPWQVRKIMVDRSFEAVAAKATEITDRHANGALAGKAKRWHNDPATPGQIKMVLRGMRKRQLPPEYANITKGRASELINQYQAIDAILEHESKADLSQQMALTME